MLKVRDQIPWVFGNNTYVYAAIAANGGFLRETDITSSLGEAATRTLRQPDRDAVGMVRRFELRTQIGRGPRGYAVMFDETFPLAKEARALARKIGEIHPLPIDNKIPKETPPPARSRKHDIDLLTGSKVNTLVLAAVRLLRGKVGRVELEAAVPHSSLTAVERAVQRLREYRIIDVARGGIYFKNVLWLPELEKLFDGYLRLRPTVRDEIRSRLKTKQRHKENRVDQHLFGYDQTNRVLTALAIHGAMSRTKLGALTMMTHDDTMLSSLVDAGILALQRETGSRTNVVVSLNAACPIYRELRALLLTLDGKPVGRVSDLSDPRDDYDVTALFNTPALLKALLFMNAVREREIDVATLNQLRAEHPKQVLFGRMHWLVDQSIAKFRSQGLVRYYSLDSDYTAHKPLKRLLNRIGNVWPEMVEAAAFADEVKPERRKTQDRNAKKRRRAKTTR